MLRIGGATAMSSGRFSLKGVGPVQPGISLRYSITTGVDAGDPSSRPGNVVFAKPLTSRLCMIMRSDSSSGPTDQGAWHTAAHAQVTRVGRAARLSGSAGVFEHIFDADVSLCVWNRQRDEMLAAYLQHTLSDGSWERIARVDPRDSDFENLLRGFEAGLGKIRLMTELTCLVDLLAILTDASSVGVRMIATRDHECPRFHIDRVGMRLLCTWIGEGTEWLAHEDVNRDQLGHQSGKWAEVRRRGARVRQMKPFAVGLFKGELWPGNAGRGAVHRSPLPRGWRVMVSLDAL
jgi:hypothetical protein